MIFESHLGPPRAPGAVLGPHLGPRTAFDRTGPHLTALLGSQTLEISRNTPGPL